MSEQQLDAFLVAALRRDAEGRAATAVGGIRIRAHLEQHRRRQHVARRARHPQRAHAAPVGGVGVGAAGKEYLEQRRLARASPARPPSVPESSAASFAAPKSRGGGERRARRASAGAAAAAASTAAAAAAARRQCRWCRRRRRPPVVRARGAPPPAAVAFAGRVVGARRRPRAVGAAEEAKRGVTQLVLVVGRSAALEQQRRHVDERVAVRSRHGLVAAAERRRHQVENGYPPW